VAKKSPTDEQRMLARLDRARDDASLSEAEAREILKAEGVDVDAEFKLLLEGLGDRHEVERKKRLADFESAYRALEPRTRTTVRHSRNDNMGRIRAHQQRHPELTAHFRDLTYMSDDDLQSLVDQLDELEADEETEMAIVIRDVPPGHHWGWFSREDPRMHIQTVDKAHLNRYKVWLEERGHRVFQVEKQLPSDVEARLRAAVKAQRAELDAAWISHLINKQWIALHIAHKMITLRIYPGTAHEFTRQIDLAEHIPRHADTLTAADIELSQDPVAVVVWPRKPAAQQEHIDLTDIVFVD
jgi:hypothetical protein